MNKIAYLFAFIFMVTGVRVFADSPLTSTQFSGAYADVKMVAYCAEHKQVDKKVAKFLRKKKVPLAHKLAAINAMGWNFDGQTNARTWMGFLAKKYGWGDDFSLYESKFPELSGEELICLGYMMAMDDYFNVKPAIPILEMGVKKLPKSFAAHMMLALVRAQDAMSGSFCKVWQLVNGVVEDDSLTMDLSDSAVANIMEYISLYSDDC